ncbi:MULTISPECIES: FadR/GntR family transcriptional regulator [Phyllobacterium]|jgi:GntR family transcriptional repressor for pyruvate dehydrogenase complex|uniref:Pyruvate dehydrogenase complex repressor n=1 Tax=Phyllobacterium sophorae TaxID=1520277 RepID=A0A2P7BC30_9HYPH|nr:MULTISPECIES: FCD domain-containing protein [Phyllobacterium]PSH63979.1 GntR family transcriptional regulator [Phyllobacterium sophorae]UXN63203.1 FCD domain-containing protein [Phyllobacterium sp. A18/5-2]
MSSSPIFARIQSTRTATDIVSQIETLILEGVLRVGDRLPGERDLSAQFDVSRPILRSALKTLEAKGLLTTRHGGGTFVADVIGEVFSKPMMDLISSHRKAAADYLEYRREIESIAADYAAQRATEDDRLLLHRIMAAMEQAYETDDFKREAELDVELHNAIGECAHNIILLHTLRSCYRLLADDVFYNRTVIYGFPGARAKLLAQHRAIFDAIMASDPAGARTAAREHIDFIEQAQREAVRSSAWQDVSRLRRNQRELNSK